MTTDLLSFIDESWQSNADGHVGVLAAVTGRRQDFDDLARETFKVRRKYYGFVRIRWLGGEEFVPFRSGKKNESGSSGKEE